MLYPAQGSREATPSSSQEVPSDVAIHSTKEGIKGGKKKCKHHPQGTMTEHDDDNNREAGGSGMRRVSTTTHNDKRQARPPMDHFKGLLEEACPNHAFHIRYKLKDYNMMRSFMISGSLT
jgi:hypothetical protein